MLRFILRRTAFMALMLVGLLAITFTISHVAPGDPARLAAGPNATEAMVETIRAEYGLDQPLPIQFAHYIAGVVQGDLGRSITTTRPVAHDLVRYFPATLELVTFSITFSILLGVALGTIAAAFQNRWPDHMIRFFATSGVALPMFWLGLLLKFVFAQRLEWLPLGGRMDLLDLPPDGITGFFTIDAALSGDFAMAAGLVSYMILPALALSFPALASIIRVNRAEMLEVLRQDYIVAARAHGVSAVRIVAVYALRNAMLPTLAMIGLRFGWMLGGTVLVESVFDWPGIGLYAVQATLNSDFQPIMGVTLVLGMSFMLINFAIDIIYGVLDPRVRLAGRGQA
jgi:peptide/nickel transport system permease protein